MSRFALTQRVVTIAGDALLVAGIGNAGFDLHAAGDRANSFYMMGSMGMGIPIALGLALAQPERTVIVLEGEGSVLMNLGGLATVGREAPENLTIVVWDNGEWQLTGGQATAAAKSCDLSVVASGCGIENASAPADEETFERAVRRAVDSPGPHFIHAHIDNAPSVSTKHFDPIWLKYRFMESLGLKPD